MLRLSHERNQSSDGPAAFFSTPSRPAGRRLLLISYHFPPGKSVGALRWQKMAQVAAERGWGLDVITRDPTEIDSDGWKRLQDLPSGVQVYGVPVRQLRLDQLESSAWRVYKRLTHVSTPAALDPNGSQAPTAEQPRRKTSFKREDVTWLPRRPRDLFRAYWAWRDCARDLAWARDAALLAQRILTPGIHKAVITSAPPHWTHEAGRRVSAASNLPFIMDLRDPWSLTEQLLEPVASPLWLQLAQHYERKAVAQATLVITNTELLESAMGAAYPHVRERIVTAMNGCDDEPVPTLDRSERFSIRYAGTIYFDRTPRLLFRAAARVIRELALTPADFSMEFIGHLDSGSVLPITAIASQEGVGAFVSTGPARSRSKAREFMAHATMLVSLPWSHKMAIPAKIFEYIQFDAWVLILADSESAPWQLLRDTEADVVAPTDVDGIAKAIQRRYEMHARGARPIRIAQGGRFSRRTQANVLFDALEERLSAL